MPPLHQNDVLMPIGIHISDTDIGRRCSGVLQGDLPFEAPCPALIRAGGTSEEKRTGTQAGQQRVRVQMAVWHCVIVPFQW